jgi:hypothetical protein
MLSSHRHLKSDNGTLLLQRPSQQSASCYTTTIYYYLLPSTTIYYYLLHNFPYPPKPLIMEDKQKERAHKLKENGTVDRLQQRLLADLLNDPGWMVAVREAVREPAAQHNDKEGAADLMDLTLEDIVAAIVPAGKGAVPTAVQEKIMALIQKAINKAEKEDYGRRDGL